MEKVYNVLSSWQLQWILAALFTGLTVTLAVRGETLLAIATGFIAAHYVIEAITAYHDDDDEPFITITYTRSDTLENNK